MTVVAAIIATGIVSTGLPPTPAAVAAVPAPTVHYTFDEEDDLVDSRSGSTLTVSGDCPGDPCITSSSFGTDDNGSYWTWSSSNSRGGGFTITTDTELSNTYTMALKFRFSNHSGWRKIIDYKDRASDNGFYILNSQLQSYPGATGAETYAEDTVLDLVITRVAGVGTAGTFNVYSIGTDNVLTFLYDYSDPDGETLPTVVTGTPNKSRFGFFFDDVATGGEATPSGRVYDLRIWSGIALTSAELEEQTVRPDATGSVTATGGDGVVEVSWAAVSGAASYTASAIAGGVTVASCTVDSPATTCTITGLTNGTSYTIRVVSSAPGGLSPPTAASSPITPQVAGLSSPPAAVPDSTTTTSSTSTTLVDPSPSSIAPAVQIEELPETGTSTYVLLFALLLLALGAITVAIRRLT